MIARALLSGQTHDEIVAEFKVGKDTTMRIARWLDDQLPGYREVIADMETEFDTRRQKLADRDAIAMNPFGLTALKKKYPLHFLLFPNPK